MREIVEYCTDGETLIIRWANGDITVGIHDTLTIKDFIDSTFDEEFAEEEDE